MNRFVCVHGHFYQPPRENPWLDEVEIQDSARPFHDWNERITAECYRPNAGARVLDAEGYIVGILNNYSRISFNVGPTLLTWLERHAPDVYAAILAADRQSQREHDGHGNALAQAYHHAILPLADRRDRALQIAWGVRDFAARFGRAPEGLWLPETAVDLPTLEQLEEAGLRFTILSPYQAARYRPRGEEAWTPVEGGRIPTTRAYAIRLPNGRTFQLFFYNGAISSDIAFHGLLHDGAAFANRLAGAFDEALGPEGQLAHVATDGETYGHHHPHGEMALAFALRALEGRDGLRLTNYGEFLARHPPEYEVEIVGPSAWSCAHGVERWRSDCGCSTGGHPEWNQAWRTPLRRALDGLRDRIRPSADAALGRLFAAPESVRHDYVDLVRDRAEPRVDSFLERHAGRPLRGDERTEALRLLELERHLQQMYTSCGWFFDELSGIETVQILQYAGAALQLAEAALGADHEGSFVEGLAEAKSNLPAVGDGRRLFEQAIRPARLSLRNVCAHYALSSLVEEYPAHARVYGYSIRSSERRTASAGTVRLAVGQAEVRSELTFESARFTYGALYLAGHNLFGGVRPFLGEGPFRATAEELFESFERGDLPETVRRVDQHFGESTYTLRLLFRDEQRKIVALLFENLRAHVEDAFRNIYENAMPVLRNLAASQTPAPVPLRAAAEYFLNERIRAALERDPPDVAEVAARLRELERANLEVDGASVAFAWGRAAERLIGREAAPPTPLALRLLTELVALARAHFVQVDLSAVQDRFFARTRPRSSDGPPPWPEYDAGILPALAEQLRVRLP